MKAKMLKRVLAFIRFRNVSTSTYKVLKSGHLPNHALFVHVFATNVHERR